MKTQIKAYMLVTGTRIFRVSGANATGTIRLYIRMIDNFEQVNEPTERNCDVQRSCKVLCQRSLQV